MLRRQRSLAALIQPPPEPEEEDYPPPPTGLSRATLRIKTLPTPYSTPGKSVLVNAETTTSPGAGLIHRVSSLFRNTSSSAKLGSPSSERYKAAASTPDVRSPSFGSRLVKKASTRRSSSARAQPPKQRELPDVPPPPPKKPAAKSLKSRKSTTSLYSTFGFIGGGGKSNASTTKTTPVSLANSKPLPGPSSPTNTTGDEDEDDIRPPSGLGEASSMHSNSSGDVFNATPHATAFPSSTNSDDDVGDEEDEEDIRRPSGLGRAASIHSLQPENEEPEPAPKPPDNYSRSRTRSSPASTLAHLHTMLGLAPPMPAPSRIASTLPPAVWQAIASHLPLADAACCALVNQTLCKGARERLYRVLDLRTRRRTRIVESVRAPHLLPLVQGVICSGWPGPEFEPIAQLQLPALRSLTIFTPPISRTPKATLIEYPSLVAFLRDHPLLERLAIIGDPASDEHIVASADPVPTGSAFLPNLTHLHAPPTIACVLLEKLATVAANTGSITVAEPSNPSSPVTPSKKVLSAEALALLTPDSPTPSPKVKTSRSFRVPRKPVPQFDADVDQDAAPAAELKRAISVNMGLGRATSVSARTVIVQASPSSSASSITCHPHPLRVLRIAMPKPLYETASGVGTVGGARIGRAIAGLLTKSGRKDELALHLMLGPRVDKRTMEKVLRTVGAGVNEGLDAAKIKQSGNLALMEVRSSVRSHELYKTITTVLPRYPMLRTLLLTRPARRNNGMGSNPPSPLTPTFFFPSPPATPGFRSSSPATPGFSIQPPPSPSFAAAQSLPLPPSPSIYASAPSTPTTLAPAPSLYTRRSSIQLLPPGLMPPPPPSPSGSTFSRRTATGSSPRERMPWQWEWDGWRDAGDVLTDAGLDTDERWEDEHTRLHLDVPVPVDVDYYDSDTVSFEDPDPDPSGVMSREDALRVHVWRRHCRALERVRMVSGAWWVRDEEEPKAGV
uniref:F-box domain-containing protein n=1 Tax=Mycena chlorophos TaxID=658473 RepID=A0ABQ0M8V5_MYCCL|nr:predicted protein [Mycena chlorophos]